MRRQHRRAILLPDETAVIGSDAVLGCHVNGTEKLMEPTEEGRHDDVTRLSHLAVCFDRLRRHVTSAPGCSS